MQDMVMFWFCINWPKSASFQPQLPVLWSHTQYKNFFPIAALQLTEGGFQLPPGSSHWILWNNPIFTYVYLHRCMYIFCYQLAAPPWASIAVCPFKMWHSELISIFLIWYKQCTNQLEHSCPFPGHGFSVNAIWDCRSVLTVSLLTHCTSQSTQILRSFALEMLIK